MPYGSAYRDHSSHQGWGGTLCRVGRRVRLMSSLLWKRVVLEGRRAIVIHRSAICIHILILVTNREVEDKPS